MKLVRLSDSIDFLSKKKNRNKKISNKKGTLFKQTKNCIDFANHKILKIDESISSEFAF